VRLLREVKLYSFSFFIMPEVTETFPE
jgi:hypothetical protein